jgi:hypothetical protein
VCRHAPDDDLVWSRDLARSLAQERGEVIEVARFSRLSPGAPFRRVGTFVMMPANARTDYHLVEVDGSVALEADAAEGGSGCTARSASIRAATRSSNGAGACRRRPRRRLARSPPILLSLGFDGDPSNSTCWTHQAAHGQGADRERPAAASCSTSGKAMSRWAR